MKTLHTTNPDAMVYATDGLGRIYFGRKITLLDLMEISYEDAVILLKGCTPDAKLDVRTDEYGRSFIDTKSEQKNIWVNEALNQLMMTVSEPDLDAIFEPDYEYPENEVDDPESNIDF